MEEQTIIINDLLSFLWCKVDVVSRETLLKCVETFYSEDFANDALQSLLSALPMEIKQSHLDNNPFIAMLDIIEQSPKDHLPTFVCRNLNNIPEIGNLSKKTILTSNFDDGAIYREHRRLAGDLKALNKSLSDLNDRLQSFVNKKPVNMKIEAEDQIIYSDVDYHHIQASFGKGTVKVR